MTKKKNESKLSRKDKIMNGIWWFASIISVLFIGSSAIQLLLGVIREEPGTYLVAALLMLLLFVWIYNVSTKAIKTQGDFKVGYKPIIFAIGIILILIFIGMLVGFYEGLTGDSEKDKYLENIENINQNNNVPFSNSDEVYKTAPQLDNSKEDSYKNKIDRLNEVAGFEELNCQYPNEQVGEICCIRSEEAPNLCKNEFDSLMTKLEYVETITIANQSFNLNGEYIKLPGDYYILEDVTMAGSNIDIYLYSSDYLDNYYEMKIIDHGFIEDINHEEYSYFLFNTYQEIFGTAISEIQFYKNNENKISFFDYTLEDDFGEFSYNRYALVEKDSNYYVITYSSSTDSFINEVNLIADSFN